MSHSILSRDISGFQDDRQYGLRRMQKCTMMETSSKKQNSLRYSHIFEQN
jgi:hypothetical protein